MRQPSFFSERGRGTGAYWPAGAEWFINDPLPPGPHSHPGSSEIYFVAAGSLSLTVGSTDIQLIDGDMCLIPSGAFHHPRETHSDLFLLGIVAPNRRGERLKLSNFQPDEYSPVPVVGNVAKPGPLPSDAALEASCIVLDRNEQQSHPSRPGAERAIYVVEGSAQVTVGRLSGRLGKHEFVHVPSGAPHHITNPGPEPLRILSVYILDPPGEGIAAELGVAPEDTY
jgi:mannose-6-phosphate isomerase-like protein (cupin superfamily)